MAVSSAYQRTISTDDGRGFRYETKMTALTALRLYKSANEFYLANNFAKADKFDDIVFTADFNGKWETWFIQLKQKQAATLLSKKVSVSNLRSKGDFVIRKYFESFKAIRNKFKSGAKDIIFAKSFEDSKFFLYTNAILHENILDRDPVKCDVKLLDTNPDYALNIKFSFMPYVDIFVGMEQTPLLFDFINKFLFCTRQANEEDMDLIIQKEIKEIMKVSSEVEVKYFCHQLCNFIYSWCKTGQYLTKNHVKDILSKTTLETLSGKKDDFSFEFVPSFIKYCFGNLRNEKYILYSSKTDSCLMCMKMLKQSGALDEPNKFLTLKQLSNNEIQEHLLSEWKTVDISRYLILDCEGDNVSVDKAAICNFLRTLKHTSLKNRIIMVATKSNVFANEVAEMVQAKYFTFNCSLINLTEESKQMLMNCEVLFQGYKTKLSSFMAASKKSLDDVFDMASMTQLLQGRLVAVGIKPVESIPYYVTRVLTRQSVVSPLLFTEPLIHDCFAISGISLETAIMTFSCSVNIESSLNILNNDNKVTAKIVVLEGDPATEFSEISKRVTKPFHWFELSKKGGKAWHWKKSTKGIENISEFIEGILDYVATDNIMAINDKVVVVTAEPGMGKSTLLSHLAAETKRICPYVWVLSIILNDITDLLDNENFEAQAELNTKSILAAAAGVEKGTSKFNARLFEECYNSGNMIVLLDGFDEIVPYYTSQGLALIRTLQDSPIARVWISARPVMRYLLEKTTSTLSYTIKPFEAKDQRNFLAKYWKSKMPTISNERLETFITNVLELIKKSFDEKLHQFTGIPLQTRMLAEVFYQDLKNYHENLDFVLKDRLNGVQLFEKFVAIKRGIQLEKAKITVTNAMARYEQRRLDEARELDLMHLALLTLLPRNRCKELKPGITDQKVKELKKYVSDGHEKTGIVMSFKSDLPQFIHRTFAEYFTALYFTKNYATNRNFLSSDDFLGESFEFVKYFFDRILATNQELHEAVLERDLKKVEALLRSNCNVDTLDKGGRTALHIAAALPDSHAIIKLLIGAGASVELADDVLGWKPMAYATKLGGIENISPILEKTQERLEDNVIPITWESLLKAVQGDYLQTLLHLIENGIYSVESLDDLSSQKWVNNSIYEGLTILHLAAAYDSVTILNYFLQKRSRDSKIRLIESKDANGMTPLLLAASMGKVNAVNCLLAAGANSLVSSPDGKNLIQYAAAFRSLDMFGAAVKEATLKNVEAESFLPMTVTTLITDKTEWGSHALQLLFTLYPNLVTMKTTKGIPLLIFACTRGNELAVKRLCELGADVNVMDIHGTPLHFAIAGGHEEIVKFLLSCPNIDLNARDAEGCTPLLKAAYKGNAELFEMLFNAGADVHIAANDGSNLTHAVAVSRCEPIFFFLLELGFHYEKLNSRGESGLSILQAAGAESLVKVLIPSNETVVDSMTKITNEEPSNNSSKKTKRKRKKHLSANESSAELVENKDVANDTKNNSTHQQQSDKKTTTDSIPFTRQTSSNSTESIKLAKQNPKKQAPKKKTNANIPQAQGVYDPVAFLEILKDLKGSNSPQVEEIAEKLKSFIDLAISAPKAKPSKPKNKNPQVKKQNSAKPSGNDGAVMSPMAATQRNQPSEKIPAKQPKPPLEKGEKNPKPNNHPHVNTQPKVTLSLAKEPPNFQPAKNSKASTDSQPAEKLNEPTKPKPPNKSRPKPRKQANAGP